MSDEKNIRQRSDHRRTGHGYTQDVVVRCGVGRSSLTPPQLQTQAGVVARGIGLPQGSRLRTALDRLSRVVGLDGETGTRQQLLPQAIELEREGVSQPRPIRRTLCRRNRARTATE